jgi:DNA-binding GntR family transcriptional regulator
MKNNNVELNSKNIVAYKALKDLIFSGVLSPGQKIIYRDLEERLNMSKTPIINALMMLERDNLVVSERNRGFYIRIIKRKEAEQIYELRQTLEDIAIEGAIKHHDQNDMKELKKKLDAYELYQSDVYDQKRWALDSAFHLQIASMGKNPFFAKMIEQFYENIYFMLQTVVLNPIVDCFKKDHKLIYEAINNHRLEEAKKIARDHTNMAIELLVKVIRN